MIRSHHITLALGRERHRDLADAVWPGRDRRGGAGAGMPNAGEETGQAAADRRRGLQILDKRGGEPIPVAASRVSREVAQP